MDYSEIREKYSLNAAHLGNCDVQLDVSSEHFRKGNPLGLLMGLVYSDIGRQSQPDWLYAGLLNALVDIACEGNDSRFVKVLSRTRYKLNQRNIDGSRFAAILHIRNAQGQGHRYPLTKGLSQDWSRGWIGKFRNGEDTLYALGKTLPDAFYAASILMERTVYEGGDHAMCEAYKRYVKLRRQQTEFPLPAPLRELLKITPLIDFGTLPSPDNLGN